MALHWRNGHDTTRDVPTRSLGCYDGPPEGWAEPALHRPTFLQSPAARRFALGDGSKEEAMHLPSGIPLSPHRLLARLLVVVALGFVCGSAVSLAAPSTTLDEQLAA